MIAPHLREPRARMQASQPTLQLGQLVAGLGERALTAVVQREGAAIEILARPREHVLHRYTQRLWAWRDDFGSESAWALRLGESVARKGADALWPALAAR